MTGEDEIIYYGVNVPNSADTSKVLQDIKTVYTDKIEVLKLLKVVKTARFKAFKSELEAVDFSTTVQSPRPLPGQVTTPVPSEGCKYKEPKPQDLVKLRKAIETSDLDYIRECAAANPR